jgi:hypothetical protein
MELLERDVAVLVVRGAAQIPEHHGAGVVAALLADELQVLPELLQLGVLPGIATLVLRYVQQPRQ